MTLSGMLAIFSTIALFAVLIPLLVDDPLWALKFICYEK